MFDCIIVAILRNIEIMVVPLYELVWLGMEMEWGVGFVWSWFVLFVFDCDFLGCICLIRVLVWCVVVPRLGLSVLWSRGECGFE